MNRTPFKHRRRQKSISSLKKKLWPLFSEFIRKRDCLLTTGLKDYGKCITCQKTIPRTLLQAGHFIPGRHNVNLFSERGTHAQCYNCNINLKGNTLIYRRKIVEMYGKGYDEILERENKKILQYKPPQLEAMIEIYKNKIKELSHT